MIAVPAIEGITPNDLWTTIYTILALCVLFMVVYKVFDAIRNEIERRKRKKEAQAPDLADKISRKVIEKLEPRFQEIEKNLNKDKSRLDNHDLILSDMQAGQQDVRDGLVAVCKTLLVILSYGDFGQNSKEVKEATADLTNFLAGRL